MDPIAKAELWMADYLSGVVRMVAKPPEGYRFASKRDIRKPIDSVEKRACRLLRAVQAPRSPANLAILAARFRQSLLAAPQEFFAPLDAPSLLDDLFDSLIAPCSRASRDDLVRSLPVLIRSAGEARKWWVGKRLPDPRARRHDVIGSAINGVWHHLTGQDASLYREPYGSKSKGKFPSFVAWLTPIIGLSAAEKSAVCGYRRERYRSRYASVRAEVAAKGRPRSK